RDTFVWNLNDPIVTPKGFVQSVIDDYGLSSIYHATITKLIRKHLATCPLRLQKARCNLCAGHRRGVVGVLAEASAQ
ncbi:hypothetical protein DFH11DRAFT_1518023, partial [Phellopilus nigrolimitatus]